MGLVYFDTSVFLAIFNGEASGTDIKALVRELRSAHTKVITSIITIQEVSVLSFRLGLAVKDHYSTVSKMARVQSIDKDIALTAAKLEANIIDRAVKSGNPETQKARRKWDCFHLATAMVLQCSRLFTLDKDLIACGELVERSGLKLCEPKPVSGQLFPEDIRTPIQ